MNILVGSLGGVCGQGNDTSNSGSGGPRFKPRPLRCFLRPCLQGVGDPGLVGYVSFVLLLERENKRN